MRILQAIFLTLCLTGAVQAQGQRSRTPDAPAIGPLAALLDRIPITAGGWIYLNDFAAARRNTDPLTRGAPPADRLLAPWAALILPAGFDRDFVHAHIDDPKAAMGMPIFAFQQMAGWGELPDSPVIATGIAAHEAAIVAAFERDGMQMREVAGVPVWHLRDDHEIDIRARGSYPFGGRLGMARRAALDGDVLIHTRAWPMMETILASTTSLAQETDTAAIVNAAYEIDGAGDVVNIVVIPQQPVRAVDLSVLLSPDVDIDEVREKLEADLTDGLPGLPPFLRHGLVLWQDGYETTGAIAIPYVRRDTAETARDRFEALIDSAMSPTTKKPFAELLPKDRRFEIVEAEGRHVLILGFTQQADRDEPVTIRTFMANPQNRLFNMLVRRELGLLIGAGQ